MNIRRSTIIATGRARIEIDLYGAVGTDFTAKQIRQALTGAKGRDVVLNINSPGGSFGEGLAIYNQLKAHPTKVTAYVDAEAHSAASLILQAADERVMRTGSQIMIHCAAGHFSGNAEELEKDVEHVRSADRRMAAIYSSRTGRPLEQVESWMRETKFFTAAEAVELGFADRAEGLALAACATPEAAALRERQRIFAGVDPGDPAAVVAALVRHEMTANGKTQGQAHTYVMASYPQLRAAYVAQANNR